MTNDQQMIEMASLSWICDNNDTLGKSIITLTYMSHRIWWYLQWQY